MKHLKEKKKIKNVKLTIVRIAGGPELIKIIEIKEHETEIETKKQAQLKWLNCYINRNLSYKNAFTDLTKAKAKAKVRIKAEIVGDVHEGKDKNVSVDINHIDFACYLPLPETLKLRAGKDNYFVPKGREKQWAEQITEQFIKNVKKDYEKGIFKEAVRQGKLTEIQVNEILKSVDIQIK